MRFSERNGYKPIRSIIQKESMDERLRVSLWNVLHECLWDRAFSNQESFCTLDSHLGKLIKSYWSTFFQLPLDLIPEEFEEALQQIRKYFFNFKWYETYDFIENTIEYYPTWYVSPNFKFIDDLNNVLERENSAYRIINEHVIEITSEQEIQSIETALENTNQYLGVQQHLNQALKLMSDRQKPDYRNSIKESVSALEGMCQKILKKDKVTLGDAIGQIEKQYPIHPALKASIKSLYGYANLNFLNY